MKVKLKNNNPLRNIPTTMPGTWERQSTGNICGGLMARTLADFSEQRFRFEEELHNMVRSAGCKFSLMIFLDAHYAISFPPTPLLRATFSFCKNELHNMVRPAGCNISQMDFLDAHYALRADFQLCRETVSDPEDRRAVANVAP